MLHACDGGGGFSKRTHEITHEKVTNNLFMGYIMLAH